MTFEQLFRKAAGMGCRSQPDGCLEVRYSPKELVKRIERDLFSYPRNFPGGKALCIQLRV